MLNVSGVRTALSRWKFKNFSLDSVERFANDYASRTGIYSIGAELPIHLIYSFKAKELPLLVWFHGAVDQSKTQLPHFVGTSLAAKLNCNSLHVADPTFHVSESLRACWYIGNEELNFQQVLAQLVHGLSVATQAPRTVLFGSSGGGYPCLAMSTLLENVVAVVNSPSTTLLNHPNAGLVANFSQHCFPQRELTDFTDTRVLCMMNGFKTKPTSRVVYIMNSGDTNNIRNFAGPFFAQFGLSFPNEPGDYPFPYGTLIVRDWGAGHKYPPVGFLIETLSKSL
jgi:hypothetical protein